jgi:hypothetical protein
LQNAQEKKAKREKKVKEEADKARMKAEAKGESQQADDPVRYQYRPASKEKYEKWSASCREFFSDPLASAAKFPRPRGMDGCKEKGCVKGEGLAVCHYQLSRLLRGCDAYELTWLKRERLRWHPDKFPGREEVKALAQEMFQMLQRLIDGDIVVKH